MSTTSHLSQRLVFLFLGVVTLVTAIPTRAADFRKSEIKRLDWNEHKTVWLDDARFPVATIAVYFADGALRDAAKEAGRTQTVFDLLFSGTSKYSQKDLSEFFDFYGVGFSHSVTHEYSVLSFSGLVKDLPTVVERFCHVVKEANFPREELIPHKQRTIAKLRNLPSQHAALAERAFRSVMMKGSSYEYPTEGGLASLELLRSEGLAERWRELREDSVKRFYVKGPKEALFIKDKFLSECGWKTAASQSYRLKNPLSGMGHRIFFVPVPGANQAQIRIGRYLSRSEARDPDESMSFASDYLGGGFTSLLIQEARVKRGLTYSIGAYVSLQADYGRSGISTFTKNETVADMLKLLRELLTKSGSDNGIKPDELEHVRKFVIGNYPFSFEGADKFLQQLMSLDHLGEPLDKLYLFPERVQKLSANDIAGAIRKLFTWDELVIVVVGDPSIRGQLESIRKVEVVRPESLL